MCACVFLESGLKSGEGLDNNSISGDEPIFKPSFAPRVHFSKLGNSTKSKLDVHVKSIASLLF